MKQWSPKISYAGYSHIGMKRAQNQDSFLCIPDLSTFVVADGMGGHKGGETASLVAVTTVCDYIRMRHNDRNTPAWNAAEVIRDAVLEANKAVYAQAQVKLELQGMGTTCTALMIDENMAYIGHVGDSRCYLNHPQKIWQLTRDHSLVQEKLRAGLITRAELKTDRMKNVITRSVGFEPGVEVDVYTMEIHPGDAFLICSDGLSGLCEDFDINKLITEFVFQKKNLDLAARELCEAANKNGGDDNVTTVLVTVG